MGRVVGRREEMTEIHYSYEILKKINKNILKMNWVLGSVRELQEEMGCSCDRFVVYIY